MIVAIMRTYIYNKASQKCSKAPQGGFVSTCNYVSYTPSKTVVHNKLAPSLVLRGVWYEWLSVILHLFVFFLMFARNGDGAL